MESYARPDLSKGSGDGDRAEGRHDPGTGDAEPSVSGESRYRRGVVRRSGIRGRSPITGPVGPRASSYLRSVSRSRSPRGGAGGCIGQRTRPGSCSPALSGGVGGCGRL